ncbi:MAG: glycosyltransferase [Nanoarchaeota archaeon]|nr:glycosyltransferase [Nanoarchaeota archaeon]
MADKILVSVVIPSYNSQKYLGKCLASLKCQQTYFGYEVIIVDSSRIKPKISYGKLIHLDKKTLPGGARNIGVKNARGTIIAFIDADCIADNNWLANGVIAMQKCDIVGGGVANANPGIVSNADHILTFNEFLPTMPKRNLNFMPTCNLFINKNTFNKIGGFRDDIKAGEDTIFGYEAAKKYTQLFDPRILIHHHNRTNFKSFLKHHRNFGIHSAMLRRKLDLPGKSFAKYPFLVPIVPFVRYLRIALRIKHKVSFLISSPIIMIGLLSWSVGFIEGLR